MTHPWLVTVEGTPSAGRQGSARVYQFDSILSDGNTGTRGDGSAFYIFVGACHAGPDGGRGGDRWDRRRERRNGAASLWSLNGQDEMMGEATRFKSRWTSRESVRRKTRGPTHRAWGGDLRPRKISIDTAGCVANVATPII